MLTTSLPQGGWAQFMLSGKEAPARAGAKVVCHLNLDAEGHEGACRVPMAQQVTLHAILSIAKDIPVVV